MSAESSHHTDATKWVDSSQANLSQASVVVTSINFGAFLWTLRNVIKNKTQHKH